jgi:hypothetical protein
LLRSSDECRLPGRFRHDADVLAADNQPDFDVQQLCLCVLLSGLHAILGVHGEVYRDPVPAVGLHVQPGNRYSATLSCQAAKLQTRTNTVGVDIYVNIKMASASRLKQLNTLYTSCLKLIGSRGHVTVDAQKRPKLNSHRSC